MSTMSDIASYCPEWTDNERMSVMFAPMRHKELNPESWNSKILFWGSLISKWVLHNKKCCVTLEVLEKAFLRDGKSPHCLQEVVSECVKTGLVVDQARFVASIAHKGTWGGWVKSVGWGAVQSLGDRVVGHNPSSLVVPQVAEKLMEEMLSKLKSVKPLLKLKQYLFLTEEDLEDFRDSDSQGLIEFLCAKKLVEIKVVENTKIYKISLDNSIVAFDETDVGIIKLHQTLGILDTDIESLEDEVKNLGDKVKQLLKSNSRQSAKSFLQRQKIVEKNLEKKLNQKLNTESILDEILGAESNKTVVDSYKAGLEALKATLNDKSFEDVDDVMDEINDTLMKGNDLTTTISKNILDDSVDTIDLEQELNDLSKEDSDLDLSKELITSSASNEDKELLEMLEKLEVENELVPEIKHPDKERKTMIAS
eukprot:GFUD01039195.1.p1 GENE.GFUD01039195.1~~GFUD01039195.1.p1  ORF type:complete len:423 (+),score=142.15 GFUD01039195.1:44-1312(+)